MQVRPQGHPSDLWEGCRNSPDGRAWVMMRRGSPRGRLWRVDVWPSSSTPGRSSERPGSRDAAVVGKPMSTAAPSHIPKVPATSVHLCACHPPHGQHPAQLPLGRAVGTLAERSEPGTGQTLSHSHVASRGCTQVRADVGARQEGSWAGLFVCFFC